MSALTAGVYTSHTLTTDGRKVISPDTGAQYGEWERARTLAAQTSPGAWQHSNMVASPTVALLPAGVYTSHTLTTDGRKVISPDTGAQYGAWSRVYQLVYFGDTTTATWRVVGEIRVAVDIPPPQGFAVIGTISATFNRVVGTVTLTGAFTCAGEIDAVFTIPTANSFQVAGNIHAAFYTRGGQLGSCIAGSGSPAAGSTPWNAAY